MVKVGLNDPCLCGSGKKYKRCCLEAQSASPRAKDGADQVRKTPISPLATERDFAGRLLGRPFIDTAFQGQRVRAVGNQIVFRPLEETSHEFFIGVLCTVLGTDWHEAQIARPEADQHVVERWVATWEATRRGKVERIDVRQEGEHHYSSTATGDLKALLCLAYDVYTLRHAGVLPAALVKRLRNSDQFQGARYELAVAAVFARAGCELQWITDRNRKLPEFIARHPSTGTEIAVEAKSRHRSGVLGRPGNPPDITSLKVDVDGLMAGALEKETDGRPFVICLDMNLPTVSERTFEEWLPELHERVLARYSNDATGVPEPFAAVFFTNYSWHWDGDGAAGEPMHFVVRPLSTPTPVPPDEARLLAEALFQYGDVP